MSVQVNRVTAQAIGRTIARAQRRIRWQRGFENGTTAVIPGAALALVALLLWKLGLVPAAVLTAGLAVAAAVVAGGLLLGFLRPVPKVWAARALDARADLADRIGSAWDFGQATERSPFMEAAIRDAASRARTLRIGRLFRLNAPRDWPVALLLIFALGALVALRFPPPGGHPVLPRPPPPPPPLVPAFQAALAQQKLEETRKEAEHARDSESRKLVGQLEALWKKIQERTIDKRSLWQRLAALQKQRQAGLSEGDQAELGRLRKMGEALAKADLTKELGDALKQADLARAQEALRELARKLKREELGLKQREQLAKALKAAAQKRERELQSRRRELDQLRKHLQKRKLEKLTREGKERELERLSRELEKMRSMLTAQLSEELMEALRQLRKQSRGEAKQSQSDAGKSLERAAERLEELLKRLKRMQLMARSQDHIREMKELLRRGPQKDRDDQLRDFMMRAGNGKGDLTLLLPGGEKEGSCSRCGGKHSTNQHGQGGLDRSPSNQPSSGIGRGTDFRLGNPTDIKDAKYQESQLAGKKGRGESTSEIFQGAAVRGFSRVGYRNVYQKYREVVEEALEKNKGIPHGYKRIVEKYFEMIRPK
jgi:hypothetical protein